MHRVAIIDYGMGNLRSVAKALETVATHARIEVTHRAETILSADHIVFPGVGAIRDCMAELQRLELDAVIREVSQNKPFLGICLGMQALMTCSEENGGTEALDIIPGEVRHFSHLVTKGLKIPHMGWNQVHQSQSHPLWTSIEQNGYFYFVHSYYVVPDDQTVTAATSEYPETFTCALHQDNIFAVQFHPEKSQHAGLQLLQNFLQWDGQS